jgi:uncharacterized ubiquitin-like protein YukD
MDSVIVTLRYNQKEVDLELPLHVPLSGMAAKLLESLQWSGTPDDTGLAFVATVIGSGRTVQPGQTLAKSAVTTGDILELKLIKVHTGSLAGLGPGTGTGAYLQSADGQKFPLRGRSVLIGRRPATVPDLDLSPLDREAIVSRRHAQIWRNESNQYQIKDLNSANGTSVDHRWLDDGGRASLREGSQIQFGEGGPILTFHFALPEEAKA